MPANNRNGVGTMKGGETNVPSGAAGGQGAGPSDLAATPYRRRMFRIAITAAGFEAIAATLPRGSVGYENATNEQGERLIWLEPNVVNRLRAMRGPGERYSHERQDP